MLLLTAQTWQGRPSEYLGPIAPVVGLLIDEALALRLAQERTQRTSQPDAEVIGAGSRYEGPDDWGVPLYDEARAQASREAFREQLRREGVKVH